ncbi:MAG TPA: peptidoglycan DD-metalloendopeptidase family protein [Chitinophagaceae bacterium]|nr:peptidoglycan DD-metalloendopeptidase family protein [Chitinophagaceae bacterium]
MNRLFTLLFSFLLMIQFQGYAQSKTQEKQELELKRQETLKEIEEINATLKEVQKGKKESVGQLTLIKRKLALRQNIINTISSQIENINTDINYNLMEIVRLRNDLDTLKKEYAKSIIYAYKSRSSFDFLNFIFSASSFNDVVRRIAYLRTYRAYRAQQAETITITQQQIADKLNQLKSNKDKKNASLQDQSKEIEKLAVEKKEKDEIVSQFKSKEKELAGIVENKRKQLFNYKKQIDAIVKREIREAEDRAKAERKKLADAKAREKANLIAAVTPKKETSDNAIAKADKPTVKKESIDFNLSEKDFALASDFAKNQNRLPWPVDNGYLIAHFGPNVIEGTKIRFDNNGITISTPPETSVKAVFDGEVSSVFNIEGNYGVTIRHGNYYTTYGNLSSVNVVKNALVKAGQLIGRSGASDTEEGRGQVEFLLTKELKYLNPESWLRKR